MSPSPERPTCPHCLRPIPWAQVCSCPEARAARLARKAERERRAELRRMGMPVMPMRDKKGSRYD